MAGGFKRNVRFDPFVIPKETDKLGAAVGAHLNDIAGKLNKTLLQLERTSGSTAAQSITIISGGGGGSSGGAVVVGSDTPANFFDLAIGTNVVTFSSAMTSSFILLWRTVSMTGGYGVAVDVPESLITSTGFTVQNVSEPCRIYYETRKIV